MKNKKRKFNKAIEEAQAGNYDYAYKIFTKVIYKYPPPTEHLLYAAFVNRGNVSSKLYDYRDALSDYNKAIKINPCYDEAYINRGNLFEGLGFYDEALSDYNKALEINPDSIEALNNRGNLYRIIGNYEESNEDLNKTLEIDPTYDAALLNRGLLGEYINDYSSAIEDLSSVIELGDKDGSAHYQRACIYRDYFGMKEKAMEDFRTAASLGNLHAQRIIQIYELGRN